MAFNGEMFDIMSWLPIKPLYRLSTMAKTCKDFLSETYFVKKQCHNSCSKTDECLIIQEDSCLTTKVGKLQFSFLSEAQSYNGIPKKTLEFLVKKGRILASSNGLIVGRTMNSKKPTELFLCNPATRTWLPVKLPNKELAKRYQTDGSLNIALECGNACSKENIKFPLDYTLLMFVIHDIEDWNSGYDIYMFEAGSNWVLKHENMITTRSLNFDDQVFCRDGLYILSNYGSCFKQDPLPYIFHYDIVRGTSRILTVPQDRDDQYFFDMNACIFRLFGWERKMGECVFESICLVKYFDKMIKIWVLEEDNSKRNEKTSSWRWLINIAIVDVLGIKEISLWTNSFTILGKNLIFADGDGNVSQYCLEGDENYCKLEVICKYEDSRSQRFRFNSYSTTLRPCIKDLIKPPRRIK